MYVYVHTEEEHEMVLSKILTASWYTDNMKLQTYLQNEWLSCKPVSCYKTAGSVIMPVLLLPIHSFGVIYSDSSFMERLTLTTTRSHSTVF